MELEARVRVRDRNQITLPARVAARLGVSAGDALVVTVAEGTPPRADLRPVLRSYAGVAGGLYGATPEERTAYLAEERASWGDADAGTASDGTPYLTFEQSRRVYWQTEVTPERYAREPKLRWQKCDLPACRRSIANMREHRSAHASGLLDERGDRTDAAQVARTRSRVAKWRRSTRGENERVR